MSDLPNDCKDCAEYGSPFCEDCLDEQNKKLSNKDKIKLSKTLRSIANDKGNER